MAYASVSTRGYLRDNKVFSFRPSHHEANNENLIVGGAYVRFLRVSSFLGIAPLRFTPHGRDYVVAISQPSHICASILITILLSGFFYGTIINQNQLLYTNGVLQILTTSYLIYYMIISVAFYGASCRMTKLFKFMNTIALVDQSFDTQYSDAKEYRLWRCLAAVVFVFALIVALDCVAAYYANIQSHWYIIRCISNTFTFFSFMLEMQFTVIAMFVRGRFEVVNKILSLTAKHLAVPYVPKAEYMPTLNIFSKRSTPMLPKIIRKSDNGEHSLAVPLTDAVQRISFVYGLLCDVVDDINNSYSLIMVSAILSSLINLVAYPFYILSNLKTNENFYIMQLINFMWTCLHLVILLMLVEPCQNINDETARTVSCMISACPARGALAANLKVFSRQLMLRHGVYRPMAFFNLNRSLIAPVIGLATTYMVILLQFQNYNSE